MNKLSKLKRELELLEIKISKTQTSISKINTISSVSKKIKEQEQRLNLLQREYSDVVINIKNISFELGLNKQKLENHKASSIYFTINEEIIAEKLIVDISKISMKEYLSDINMKLIQVIIDNINDITNVDMSAKKQHILLKELRTKINYRIGKIYSSLIILRKRTKENDDYVVREIYGLDNMVLTYSSISGIKRLLKATNYMGSLIDNLIEERR